MEDLADQMACYDREDQGQLETLRLSFINDLPPIDQFLK